MTNEYFRTLADGKTSPQHGPDFNGHFVGQALHMLSRLRDHIERLDNGVVYAEDDLAVVLRALVYHTHGNHVLQRLSQLAGLSSAIEVRLSRPPLVASDDLKLSVGSLPTSSPSDDDGSSWVKLDRWRSRPLVRLRKSGHSQTHTWGDFLNDYANKWGGAHLDREIPALLVRLEAFEVGRLSLSGFLLRQASVQAWLIGQVLLDVLIPAASEDAGAVRRLGGRGAITTDPTDRRILGELQWLDYKTETLDFLIYVVKDMETELRIQPGGLGYFVRFSPTTPSQGMSASLAEQAGQLSDQETAERGAVVEVGKAAAPKQTQRVRGRNPAVLTANSFSRDRNIQVGGRFNFFPEQDSPAAGVEGQVTLIPDP